MLCSSVYMFHSIGEGSDIFGADPHYSYSTDQFIEFLKSVRKTNSLQNCLEEVNGDPLLTFDDGHKSNLKAAELICEYNGGSADFFVNPNTIDTQNYLSWSELKRMNNMGMSIQSHSLDHIYLSDLSYYKQKQQLANSKSIIEDKLGTEVTVLAPPGGRFNQHTVELCHSLGYKHLSVSKPGRWKGGYTSPRIPVLRSTPLEELIACSNIETGFIKKQVLKYRITGMAKKALGNKSYDFIRSKLLGDAA